MININAGNLWTMEYLSKVIELNDKHKAENIRVASIFGSISKLTPTARSSDRIPYLKWSEIDKFIDTALAHDIQIRYTLNASCLGSMQDFKQVWDGKLKADITELHNIGVTEWVVTSPLLLTVLKDMFPNDFFEVSTIAEVDSPLDAMRWQQLGANGVNLSTNINRDFTLIKSIVKTGITVSILANEACLYHCPFRRDCYNFSSHDSQRGEDLFNFYPFRYCNEIRIADKVEWLKSRMVLPQWMKRYQEDCDVDWFKVAFRTHPYEVAVPILAAYMNQIYKGNYLDLWPTIRRLGDTAEPQDLQYISCEALDRKLFISRVATGMIKCNDVQCAQGCTFCNAIIEQIEQEVKS